METKLIHATGFQIIASQNDVYLQLVSDIPCPDRDQKVRLQRADSVSAFMSPQTFKKFVEQVTVQLNQYEKKFGKLS